MIKLVETLPKFSIVVPVFHGVDRISEALRSLVEQDYPDLEIIVVDGESVDGTLQEIEKFREHISTLISESDNGQSDAINKGFRCATGDIVGWLCHDDTLTEGTLLQVGELFAKNPEINLITGSSRRIYDDGFVQIMTPKAEVFERIGIQNGIEQPATFWRADLGREAGEINEDLHFAMDWDFWNRLVLAGAKGLVVDKVFANYYFSVSNKTSSNPDGNLREGEWIVRRYGPFDGALASAYRLIFDRFDLAGCFDPKGRVPRSKRKEYKLVMNALKGVFGSELINGYNWQWISKQKRGLVWR